MKPLACLLFIPLLAAQPRLQNGRVETHAASSPLRASIEAILNQEAGPAWIGYSAPQVPGEHNACHGAPADGVVRLEGATDFFVLFRIDRRQIEKVRAVSVDCELDAGGLVLHWLTGVAAAQSVAFLESLVPAPGERAGRAIQEQALSTIALHRDPGAVESLLRFAKTSQVASIRSNALFWLAQRASRQIAEETIRAAIADDPETQVKQQAVFALTRLPDGAGVPILIELARSNRNAVVRKQAMFWLGQSKDPRATAFFEEILASK